MKQEAMAKDMKEKPLPDEYRESELNTTWVSPVTQMLYLDADNRFVLRKPSRDAYKLKMDVPACFYEQRPMSMPLLQTSVAKAQLGERRPGTSGSMSSVAKNRMSAAWDSEVAANTSNTSMTASAPALPRVCARGEILTFEPPSNLNSKHIVNRLEVQAKAFRKGTFAEYVKECDIFTGAPKVRIDPRQLERQEKGYIRKMRGLVGGRALRVTFAASQAQKTKEAR